MIKQKGGFCSVHGLRAQPKSHLRRRICDRFLVLGFPCSQNDVFYAMERVLHAFGFGSLSLCFYYTPYYRESL